MYLCYSVDINVVFKNSFNIKWIIKGLAIRYMYVFEYKYIHTNYTDAMIEQ